MKSAESACNCGKSQLYKIYRCEIAGARLLATHRLRTREAPSNNQVKHVNSLLACLLAYGTPTWLNRAPSRHPNSLVQCSNGTVSCLKAQLTTKGEFIFDVIWELQKPVVEEIGQNTCVLFLKVFPRALSTLECFWFNLPPNSTIFMLDFLPDHQRAATFTVVWHVLWKRTITMSGLTVNMLFTCYLALQLKNLYYFGLGFRPMPPADNVESTLIWYKATDELNYKHWTESLKKFLEVYRKPGLTPGRGENIYSCDYGKPPHKGQVCNVDVKNWEPCTEENRFNYHKSSPCIFIKLNKIYNWVPEFYNSSVGLPADMPHDLKNYIADLEMKNASHMGPRERMTRSMNAKLPLQAMQHAPIWLEFRGETAQWLLSLGLGYQLSPSSGPAFPPTAQVHSPLTPAVTWPSYFPMLVENSTIIAATWVYSPGTPHCQHESIRNLTSGCRGGKFHSGLSLPLPPAKETFTDKGSNQGIGNAQEFPTFANLCTERYPAVPQEDSGFPWAIRDASLALSSFTLQLTLRYQSFSDQLPLNDIPRSPAMPSGADRGSKRIKVCALPEDISLTPAARSTSLVLELSADNQVLMTYQKLFSDCANNTRSSSVTFQTLFNTVAVAPEDAINTLALPPLVTATTLPPRAILAPPQPPRIVVIEGSFWTHQLSPCLLVMAIAHHYPLLVVVLNSPFWTTSEAGDREIISTSTNHSVGLRAPLYVKNTPNRRPPVLCTRCTVSIVDVQPEETQRSVSTPLNCAGLRIQSQAELQPCYNCTSQYPHPIVAAIHRGEDNPLGFANPWFGGNQTVNHRPSRAPTSITSASGPGPTSNHRLPSPQRSTIQQGNPAVVCQPIRWTKTAPPQLCTEQTGHAPCPLYRLCSGTSLLVTDVIDCRVTDQHETQLVIPGFLQVGIVLGDAVGQRIFSGISHLPCPCIPVLLHTHLISSLLALKTLLLRVVQISPLNSSLLNTVWVSCAGENPADVEYLGRIEYIPHRGFPGYFYPYENSVGYLSPILAIHLVRPRTGILINIECRAWARNIQHDRHERVGMVHFELMID
ncbi:hypothetical protein PR048_021735 [Dryococelus australis]|uniref:Sodium/potassium-transporting ATPase subunit beta-2 n=1 Tax=Dryococelus australis TaxID=614101 RepID=A0ABQ9GZ94_9NEOP|nr:hypothetical protein PR048_021735 [Dryococelus australis]